MNKYNIKVGDYVETWDGAIGVVESIANESFGCEFTFISNSNNYVKNVEYWFLNDSTEIFKLFKRIGANDFNKKKDKFQPISKYNQNGIVTYADKLNELIDHINAIQERLNEYDGTRTD